MEQQAKSEFVIRRINDTYKVRIRSLQSDQLLLNILPDEDEIRLIGQYIGANWPDRYAYEKMADLKEAITIFLVGCAYYHYNDRRGGFWKSVGDMMGEIVSSPRADTLYKLFEKTVQLYGLLCFEEDAEESYRYVTPIQCHGGIPANCLNALIERLAQTIEDRSFGRGNLTDSFLYLCRYGVNRPVLRYIEYLRDVGQSDEWLNKCRDTLTEIARGTVPLAVEQQELLMRSFCSASQEWLAQNKQASNTIRRGIHYEAPLLRLDEDNGTICLELPQQYMHNAEDALLWSVMTSGHTLRIRRSAQPKAQEVWFAPYSLAVEDIRELSISMSVPMQEGELQREWRLINTDDACLVFSRYGRQRLSDWLPEGEFFVVPIPPYRLREDSWERAQELMGGCTAYLINTYGMDCVDLVGNGRKPVRLMIRKEPVLFGRTMQGLVDDTSRGQIFNDWPEITLPAAHGNQCWRLEAHNVYTGEQAALPPIPGGQTISLATLLQDSGGYGKYRVSCFHNEHGTSRFVFSCLPHLEILNQTIWYWPFAGGYETVLLRFRCEHADMKILDETGTPICASIPIDVDMAWFSGSVLYHEQRYPFTVAVRPYTFCFMDDQGIVYGKVNQTSRFTLRDMNAIVGLSLNLTDSGAHSETLKARISIVSEGEEAQGYSITLSGTRSIPMEMFYDRIGTLPNDLAELKLCIADRPEVTLALIRLDAAVSNLHERQIKNGWLLQWEEIGPRRNRALYLTSLSCPWLSTRIPIVDGDCYTMLERMLVPWKGLFLVWVSSMPASALLDSQEEPLPKPDSQALILRNYDAGSYQPMDPFTVCFYENMINGQDGSALKRAFDVLPSACFGISHIGKLLRAYFLLHERQDILQGALDCPEIQSAYVYCLYRLVALFGCQVAMEAVFTAGYPSVGNFPIEHLLELDFPTRNGGKPVSAPAWDSLRRRNPPLALLYAYCDGDDERLFTFLRLLQGQEVGFAIQDAEPWQSVNGGLFFLGCDDPTFIREASQVTLMPVEHIRSANKDVMLKLVCTLLKAYANGAQLQCKPILRKWISDLSRDHIHKYTEVLFNTLIRKQAGER